MLGAPLVLGVSRPCVTVRVPYCDRYLRGDPEGGTEGFRLGRRRSHARLQNPPPAPAGNSASEAGEDRGQDKKTRGNAQVSSSMLRKLKIETRQKTGRERVAEHIRGLTWTAFNP